MHEFPIEFTDLLTFHSKLCVLRNARVELAETHRLEDRLRFAGSGVGPLWRLRSSRCVCTRVYLVNEVKYVY